MLTFDTVRELWDWVAQVLRENLGRAIVVAIAMAVITKFWRRISTFFFGARHDEAIESPRPAATWPASELARVYTVADLKDGFIVAPATQMVVVDRGVKQFTLEPGRYDRMDIARRLQKKAVTRSGVALQYALAPLVVSANANGNTEVVLDVRVLDDVADKVLTWAPLRDGVARASEVQELIQAKVHPWLEDRLRAETTSMSAAALIQELEPFLNEQVFAQHGLAATVRSITLAGV